RLIKNDVKVLVDVRKNPLSMKYGFSKTRLKRYCNSVNIEYIHFPQVGINSQKRQELNNQKDYDALFSDYSQNQLPTSLDTQKYILNILLKNKRIALTCFEANICQCHRKPLAEALKSNPKYNFPIQHI